jgi:hypothetical protein
MSTLAQRVTGWFSKTEEQAAAASEAALRSDRFRLEREAEWKRLEAIVTRMEKGRLRGISDEDLLALPVLYRTAASSLSIARETSLDRATLSYLESLTQRAWFLVYGPRTTLGLVPPLSGRRLGAAVRAIWIDLLIALAAMVAGTVVGWLLVSSNPDWYYSLVGANFADERVPGASREVLHGTLFGHQKENGMSVFAAYLFSNNAQVSILAFALGFAFGLPSIMLLVHNTAMLGAVVALPWAGADAGPDRLAVGARHDRVVRDPAGGRRGDTSAARWPFRRRDSAGSGGCGRAARRR